MLNDELHRRHLIYFNKEAAKAARLWPAGSVAAAAAGRLECSLQMTGPPATCLPAMRAVNRGSTAVSTSDQLGGSISCCGMHAHRLLLKFPSSDSTACCMGRGWAERRYGERTNQQALAILRPAGSRQRQLSWSTPQTILQASLRRSMPSTAPAPVAAPLPAPATRFPVACNTGSYCPAPPNSSKHQLAAWELGGRSEGRSTGCQMPPQWATKASLLLALCLIAYMHMVRVVGVRRDPAARGRAWPRERRPPTLPTFPRLGEPMSRAACICASCNDRISQFAAD